MQWLGKTLGGGIGLLALGPLGAAVGASIGHKLYDDEQNAKNANLFRMTFALLGKFASFNKSLSQKEIIFLQNFIQQNKLSSVKNIAWDIFFETFTKKNINFDALLNEYLQYNNNLEEKNYIFEVCYNFCIQNIFICKTKDERLKRMLQVLDIKSNDYQIISMKFSQEVQDAAKILNCKVNDSVATIKKLYNNKCQSLHPDKLQNKNLPQEIHDIINEKLQAITWAYKVLIQSKNIQK